MMLQQSGPAGSGTGTAPSTRDAQQPTLFDSPPQPRDGARRKLDALATLQARNAERIQAAQRAMVCVLLERGRATVDDVRAELGLADTQPSRWLGAVPGELRRKGIIRRAGFIETRRAVAHARPVSVWELADGAAARAWLAANGG